MSRKDYIVIAGFMRDMKPVLGGYALNRWQEMVDYLCVRFKQCHAAFDADKFRAACQQGE